MQSVHETAQERTGEVTQWLRALAALPEDPGLIPSTHITAHNFLQLQVWEIQHILLASAGTDIRAVVTPHT